MNSAVCHAAPGHDLSLPHGFTRELAECSTLQSLIDVVAKWLPTFIPAARSSIALQLDPSDRFLTIKAMGGVLVIPTGTELGLDDSIIGRAFRNRHTINVGELSLESGSEAATLQSAQLNSALIVPLISGGECLGTMNLGSLESNAFTVRHEQMLEIIASLVASFVRVHQLAESAAQQAMTDYLTGGLNRRAILAHLDTVVTTSETAVAVLYLDLDGFKSVNDHLGHCRGDEVLRIIASRTAEVVGSTGRFGRVGGDEFVVVIADEAAESVALELAADIGQACALPIEVEGNTFTITASLGVASCAAGESTAALMIAQADASMYAAKRAVS